MTHHSSATVSETNEQQEDHESNKGDFLTYKLRAWMSVKSDFS